MRILSILITLLIIGYAMSLYLESNSLNSSDPEKVKNQPKEYIDQAKQATDDLRKNLQEQQQKLEEQTN